MRHGHKIKKLRGTAGHKASLLRNLVSALLHHESIKTTLAKAKVAARMTEKIITLGKRNNDPARRIAQGFLHPPHHYSSEYYHNQKISPPSTPGYDQPSSSSSSSSSSSFSTPHQTSPDERFEPPQTLLPKLFTTLAERYRDRQGGYTRITKFGRRQGDNAPHAIVSLVDGPRDIRFEMIARTVGREIAQAHQASGSTGTVSLGDDVRNWEGLGDRTKLGLEKVLKFRSGEARKSLADKATDYADVLFAEETAFGGHQRLRADLVDKAYNEVARTPRPFAGRKHLAGERMAGMPVTQTGLGLARAELGRIKRSRATLGFAPRFLSEKQVAGAGV